MARIRQVKPEFWTDMKTARLPRLTRLHFIALWNYVDDDGRGVDEPRLIKAAGFPLDDDVTVDELEEHQRLLAEKGRIVRYEVDGIAYFAVVNFRKHQYVQKRQPSRLPPPPCATAHDESRSEPVPVTEDYGPGQGSGVEGQGSGDTSVSPTLELVPDPPPAVPAASRRPEFFDDFEKLWNVYPRKVKKAAAYDAYVARRRERSTHEALMAAVTHYAEARRGHDQQHTQHGSTFLAGGRLPGPWSEWVGGPPDGARAGPLTPAEQIAQHLKAREAT